MLTLMVGHLFSLFPMSLLLPDNMLAFKSSIERQVTKRRQVIVLFLSMTKRKA